MYTSKNTLKISDLRHHMNEVFEEIDASDEPIVVFSRSEPKMVIMSIKTYEKKQQKSSILADDDYPKGADFFINPPEKFLIKKGNLDAVKLIRSLRD